MSFLDLPKETLFNIGSYLPSQERRIRETVLRVDPYDPALITDMLELGLDPATLVAQERERQRNVNSILMSKGGQLAKLFNELEVPFNIHENPDSSVDLTVLNTEFPLEEVKALGLEIGMSEIFKGYRITDPDTTSNMFAYIMAGDLLVNGKSCPQYASSWYKSVAYPR